MEIRTISAAVLSWLPGARKFVREAGRDPGAARQALGLALEEQSPVLSRAFFSAASSLATPFTTGMGMAIESLDDSSCIVRLPDWWRNHGDDGRVHPAAVTALAEFCSRRYWERHLEPKRVNALMRRIECQWVAGQRVEAHSVGSLRATCAVLDSERERVLLRLRAESVASAKSTVLVHGLAGELTAEIEIDWTFEAPQLLSGAGAQPEREGCQPGSKQG